MRSLFFLLCLFFLTTYSAVGQDCNKDAAKTYLNNLFQSGQYLSYDSTLFPSYSKELTEIKTPLLNKVLPNYCFFKTIFLSNYYEYMNVKTVLAFSTSKEKKSQLIHSPTFSRPSQQFIQLFYGITVSDTAQSVTLAKEITNMFSDITSGGHFNRLVNLKEKKVISFELWHSDLSWRIYDFYFDDKNKLTEIKITGGVKREEMREGYKRL